MATSKFSGVLLFGLLVLALLGYAQALHAPFVFDDTLYVSENRKLLALTFSDLWQIFLEPFNSFEFLPLRDLSYWVDLAIFGLNPAAFRIHNMILYAIACVLVYVVTYKLCRCFSLGDENSSVWTATITTGLFIVHPAHVEAVVWVSGRKDLLSGIFSLSALWMALEINSSTRRAGILIAGIVLATIGAMSSKATSIVIAPMLILISFMYYKKNTERIPNYILLALGVLPSVSVFLVFFVFYRFSSVATQPYFGVEIIERFFAILGWLTRLSISFEPRSFFYPVLDTAVTPFMVAIGVLVLALAPICLVLMQRRNMIRGFAVIAFLILCLPYCQLIPFNTLSLAGDRHLFLAVWPICLLLATTPRKPFFHLVLLALGVFWLFGTINRPDAWGSDNEVVQRDIASWPGYELPLTQRVARILITNGSLEEASRVAQGINRQDVRQFVLSMIDTAGAVERARQNPDEINEAMRKLWKVGMALNTPPNDARWNLPVAHIYQFLGVHIVKRMWWDMTSAHPENAAINYNAGLWFQKHSEDALAEKSFHAAVNVLDRDSETYGVAAKNWGVALWATGDKQGAERAFSLALQAPKPDTRAACLLASLLSEAQRHQQAESYQGICDSRKLMH